MLGNFPPFTTMQELNLDWILTKIKNILRFVPDDGAVGQILRRTPSGAEWSNEHGGSGAVNSVNGQTGDVVLTASDVGALPDTYVAPVDSVNGQTGDVVLSIPTDTADLINSAGFVDAAGAAAAAPVQMINGQTGYPVLPVVPSSGAIGQFLKKRGNTPFDYGWNTIGKSDVGLGNVDNVQQYSATNPPPYPVTSVNGQTGDVTVSTGGLNPTRIAYGMGNGGSANINLDDYQFLIFACTNNTTRIYGTTVIPVLFIKTGVIDSVYVYGGSTAYLASFSVNGLGGVTLSITGTGIYGAIYGM